MPKRIDWLVIITVVAGFSLRLAEAARTYLNPDEVWKYYFALPEDWYVRAPEFGHPPLLYFALHQILRFHTSELAMRALPLLAGSLLPWVMFRWVTLVRNGLAAWVALLLLVFSPNLILQSAQARGYMVAAFFAALALLLLERALATGSIGRVALSSTCLLLGILTEYSTVWFAGALAVYVLCRGAVTALDRRFWWGWGLGQAAVLAACFALYLLTVAPELATGHVQFRIEAYLEGAFPRPGQNLLTFAALGTLKQFAYTASSVPLGIVWALLFLMGLAWLWQNGRRALTLAILAGFLLGCGGAVLRFYPYGRTRHTLIFSIFIVAAVSVAVEELLRSRPRIAAGAAAALILGWPLIAEPDQNNMLASRHHLWSMKEAASTLRTLVPPDAVLLSDQETALLLRYAWCRGRAIATKSLEGGGMEWRLDSVRVVWRRWDFGDEAALVEDAVVIRRLYSLPADRSLLVLDGGFQAGLAEQFRARYGDERAHFHDLGGAFYLFQTPPGM